MKKIEGIIFDMDGTLYSFDQGPASNFDQSKFGQRIHENIIAFFKQQFALNSEDALTMYLDFRTRFNDEVSLGLEKERAIPRGDYFAITWNLDPQEFMKQHQELVEALSTVAIKSGILSSAPRIWVERVLDFLEIKQLFEPAIFTGDPDVRKPNPQAFLQIANFWKLPPEVLISVGDQEKTDILPAKSIGMITVRIGRDVETTADFLAKNAIEAIAILKKENII